MSRSEQRKGADGEKELVSILRRAGYPVSWGGNRTFGCTPDVSGLPGVHIEVKRRERLNVTEAMEQATKDADRFRDGAPAVFHRRSQQPWLVTMRLSDWLALYAASDHDQDARTRFFTYNHTQSDGKGDTMNFWEEEKPLTADTGKNVIEFFPASKKLSVSKPNWTDKNGDTKKGKTVIVDLEAVAATPDAVSILEQAVKNLKNR